MEDLAKKIVINDVEVLSIENSFCEAIISLHGTQVLKFHSKKHNKDLLWLSDLAKFETGKAIRGGIPLCFPWFGGHSIDTNLPALHMALLEIVYGNLKTSVKMQ